MDVNLNKSLDLLTDCSLFLRDMCVVISQTKELFYVASSFATKVLIYH